MRIAQTFALLLCVGSFLSTPSPALAQAQPQVKVMAQETSAEETKSVQTKAEDVGTIVYKPPMRGAPARRVGGATRGASQTDLVLNVLAPDQTGLTTQAQPTLYWYASKPSTTTIELIVISEKAELPVLSRNLAVTPGGVQAINLADQGVTLTPGIDYEWFVTVVSNAQQRSKDVTSGGTIRRVAADPAVLARIAAAGERSAPRIYAEAGLWYDAIAALSRLMERNPDDAELRSWRAALLDQIGLPAVAAYDRSTTR